MGVGGSGGGEDDDGGSCALIQEIKAIVAYLDQRWAGMLAARAGGKRLDLDCQALQRDGNRRDRQRHRRAVVITLAGVDTEIQARIKLTSGEDCVIPPLVTLMREDFFL